MTLGCICVAGSLHYDIIVHAPHLPGLDETVAGDQLQFACGGKGGNQAIAARQHGAAVVFAGQIGTDGFGDALLEHLAIAGIDVSRVQRSPDVASGASIAIIEQSGEYGAVIATGANGRISPDRISLPDETRILLLQNEIPDADNAVLADKAREQGICVILNAAPWRDTCRDLLEKVDWLVVNRVEAEQLLCRPITSADDAAAVIVETDLAIPHLVVTLGKDGAVYREHGADPHFTAPFPVTTVSTHGAGDAYIGALAAALLAGAEERAALTYAGAAAALHVASPVDQRHSIDGPMTRRFIEEAGEE